MNPGQWPLGAASEEVLVTDWFQQFPSHSTGALAFGADGALYATGGDGASFNYVDSGQTASTPPANDPAEPGGRAPQPGHPHERRSGHARRECHPDRSRHRAGAAGQPALHRSGRERQAHRRARPAQSVPPHRPARHERSVDRRRGLEHVGGDQPRPRRQRRGRRQLRLALLTKAPDTQSGYQPFGICQQLPANAVTPPYYTYNHSAQVVTGEACPTGSSSIAGPRLLSGVRRDRTPTPTRSALFFADYSRNCIWAMRAGADGLPNPADRVTIKSGGGGPVNLVSGPGGDIFYPGLQRRPAAPDHVHERQSPADRGRFRRTRRRARRLSRSISTAANRAIPRDRRSRTRGTWTATARSTTRRRRTRHSRTAAEDWSPSACASPTVRGSPTWRPSSISVEQHGADRDDRDAPLRRSPGGSAPRSRSAAAPAIRQEGSLPASALTWSVIMHHCPSNCHTHDIQQFVGVASGSFPAPDHEYPSHLELRLDGDRRRRSAEHRERPPESAAGHADVPVQSAGPGAGRQRDVGGDAVHAHGHHRLEQLRQRAGAADDSGRPRTGSRRGPTAALRCTTSPRPQPPRRTRRRSRR